MKKVAIIACDNGLGHVRRCYLIGLELVKYDCTVELFAPQNKFKKFESLFGHNQKLFNFDFSTHTSSVALQAGEASALRWHDSLPEMDGYDLVISDNLIEVLHVRPDAVLSGHFFWHDVLRSVPSDYYQLSEELLLRYQPIVMASKLFANERVKTCQNYTPVGLYFSDEPTTEARNGDALLITGGSTPVLRAELQTLVEKILEEKPDGFTRVFVDPDLLESIEERRSSLFPDWIEAATYDTEMYRRTRIAICRPGIGTITDLLQHGGFPLCVFERDNEEVKENAMRLEEAGLGITVSDVSRAKSILQTQSISLHSKQVQTGFVLPKSLFNILNRRKDDRVSGYRIKQ